MYLSYLNMAKDKYSFLGLACRTSKTVRDVENREQISRLKGLAVERK